MQVTRLQTSLLIRGAFCETYHGYARTNPQAPLRLRWTCIYPIYIDAKRPCGRGERRIPRAKSVWWPLSKDIADATNRLGLGTLHEVNKAHPRDWENPGRVRVQWKKDGRFVNPAIKTSTSCSPLAARAARGAHVLDPGSCREAAPGDDRDADPDAQAG